MTKTRNIADLLDANGDVVSGALDNVPASNNASALTTGTLPSARLGTVTSFRSTGIDDNCSALRMTLTNDDTTMGGHLKLDYGSANGNPKISFLQNNYSGTTNIEVNRSVNDLLFNVNSSERVRITSAGLVGIGTSAPTVPLEVYGAVKFNESPGASSGNVIIDGSATGNPQLRYYQNGTAKGYLTYWDSSDTLALTDGSANGLHFKPSNGRVGIGTSSPSGKLHIKTGNSSASPSAIADELVIESNDSAGLSILTTGGNGHIDFGDSGDNDIGRIQYNHSDNSMRFTVNAAVSLKIDSSGAVTKPFQPAVHAYLNTTQSNIATGQVTVQLNAEIYDVNSDFNTSNYTFTAPVTGKYLVTMNLVMTSVDTAFQWIYLLGVSSNRNYYLNQIDPRIEMVGDGTHTWTGSSLVDMDANDTFMMRTRSSAHGAAQMDIAGGTANSTETSMTITLLS